MGSTASSRIHQASRICTMAAIFAIFRAPQQTPVHICLEQLINFLAQITIDLIVLKHLI
jgi:hypothetical protein